MPIIHLFHHFDSGKRLAFVFDRNKCVLYEGPCEELLVQTDIILATKRALPRLSDLEIDVSCKDQETNAILLEATLGPKTPLITWNNIEGWYRSDPRRYDILHDASEGRLVLRYRG